MELLPAAEAAFNSVTKDIDVGKLAPIARPILECALQQVALEESFNPEDDAMRIGMGCLQDNMDEDKFNLVNTEYNKFCKSGDKKKSFCILPTDMKWKDFPKPNKK